jgi:TniQ
MGAESWVDRERAIWKVLPLHPRPQPLESMTSYIIRLVEANGLQSINELGVLAGRMTFSNLKSLDYPATAYPGLAQITGHPEERWFDMTFFHLIQRFGCAMNRSSFHKFLVGSLAPSLRYCPICLAEHAPAYYSLLWRFLVLPGCIEHGVRFLDQCGHCQSPLPLLRYLPQLIRCPTCQGDLRTCKPFRLSDDDVEPTDRRTNDLKMLLTPSPRPLVKEQAKLIGRRFQLLRQRQDLWVPEVASLMSRDTSIIQDIDYVRRFRQASLNDYMQYADVLGSSLREIFDEQSLEDLVEPFSEEKLLDQVETAIRQLQTRGKPILLGSVGDLVGMTVRCLKRYPRVKKLLSRCETERRQEIFQVDPQREEELVKQVEQTLKQLEARGEPIILQHVCDLVGLSYSYMVMKCPRIRALFYEYQKNRSERGLSPRLDEEAKVQQVQTAINMLVSQGESVTLRRIRQIVRLTQRQLRHSPRIKALLAPYTGKWQGEAS